MPAYLLRYAGTDHFAGFYAADSQDHLFFLIDEETDPFEYEYAVVKYGYGIEFRKRGWNVKYKIGKGERALATALGKADGVYITEAAYYALISGEDLTWQRLHRPY